MKQLSTNLGSFEENTTQGTSYYYMMSSFTSTELPPTCAETVPAGAHRNGILRAGAHRNGILRAGAHRNGGRGSRSINTPW
jgi:hypothetical protein